MIDPDRELLERLTSDGGILRRAILNDESDDWQTVKKFGQLMLRIDGESATGFFLVARSSRHLGELESFPEALQKCRNLLQRMTDSDLERQCLVEALATEARHTSGL